MVSKHRDEDAPSRFKTIGNGNTWLFKDMSVLAIPNDAMSDNSPSVLTDTDEKYF